MIIGVNYIFYLFQKKSNGSWTNGRTSSIERGRQSPAPSHVSAGAGPAASEGGGSGRRLRKRSGRRRGRHSDAQRDQQHAQHAQHPQHPSNTQHSQHTQSAAPVPPATPFTHSHAPSGLNWREEILESKKFTSHDKYVVCRIKFMFLQDFLPNIKHAISFTDNRKILAINHLQILLGHSLV